MKEISLRKNILNIESIGVITTTVVLSTLISRTKFKYTARNKKLAVNLLLGLGIMKFSKNNLAKQAGIGIFISGVCNFIYDFFQKPKCPFVFKPNKPIEDSLLINLKTGVVIQKKIFEEGQYL